MIPSVGEGPVDLKLDSSPEPSSQCRLHFRLRMQARQN